MKIIPVEERLTSTTNNVQNLHTGMAENQPRSPRPQRGILTTKLQPHIPNENAEPGYNIYLFYGCNEIEKKKNRHKYYDLIWHL
jgi:hypothetical protein